MIDIEAEKLIPLADVPKSGLIPHRRGGRRLHVSTLFRWCGRGVKGIKLECLQLGGTKVTSIQALRRFFERLTNPEQPTTQERSQRAAEQARADDYLAARLERGTR